MFPGGPVQKSPGLPAHITEADIGPDLYRVLRTQSPLQMQVVITQLHAPTRHNLPALTHVRECDASAVYPRLAVTGDCWPAGRSARTTSPTPPHPTPPRLTRPYRTLPLF
jgi:hypothetical protein